MVEGPDKTASEESARPERASAIAGAAAGEVLRRHCPLCEGEGDRLFAALRDRSFGVDGEWSLWRCRLCRNVWLDPRPRPEEIPALYGDYFTHDAPAPESGWQRRLRASLPAQLGYPLESAEPDLLDRLLGRVGPLRELALQNVLWLAREPGALLDVGCGNGSLLARMRACGWEVRGIEADPAGARRAAALLGADVVHAGTLDDAPFAAESFDAVTLFHVIEHLLEPERALRRCAELLRPGGRLVLVTPNIGSLGRALFGESWLHWDPPRHLQLFDADPLCELVTRAGLEVETCFTPSTSALPVYIGSRLIQRRGELPRLDFGGASLALRLRALAFWLREYLTVRRGERCGEDLVVIARRGPKASEAMR